MLTDKEGLNVNAVPWGNQSQSSQQSQPLKQQQPGSNNGSISAYPGHDSQGSLTPPTGEVDGPLKQQMCKFHLTGGCFRGEECPFSHDLRVEAPVGVDASAGFIFNGKVANLHNTGGGGGGGQASSHPHDSPMMNQPPQDWGSESRNENMFFEGRRQRQTPPPNWQQQQQQQQQQQYDGTDEVDTSINYSRGAMSAQQGLKSRAHHQHHHGGDRQNWSWRGAHHHHSEPQYQLPQPRHSDPIYFGGERHSLRKDSGNILFGGSGRSPPPGDIGSHISTSEPDSQAIGSLDLTAFAELLNKKEQQPTPAPNPGQQNKTPPSVDSDSALERAGEKPAIHSDSVFPALPGTAVSSPPPQPRLPQPRKQQKAAQGGPSPAQILHDAPALPSTGTTGYAGRISERADRRPTVNAPASANARPGGKGAQVFSGRGRGRGRRD